MHVTVPDREDKHWTLLSRSKTQDSEGFFARNRPLYCYPIIIIIMKKKHAMHLSHASFINLIHIHTNMLKTVKVKNILTCIW